MKKYFARKELELRVPDIFIMIIRKVMVLQMFHEAMKNSNI